MIELYSTIQKNKNHGIFRELGIMLSKLGTSYFLLYAKPKLTVSYFTVSLAEQELFMREIMEELKDGAWTHDCHTPKLTAARVTTLDLHKVKRLYIQHVLSSSSSLAEELMAVDICRRGRVSFWGKGRHW